VHLDHASKYGHRELARAVPLIASPSASTLASIWRFAWATILIDKRRDFSKLADV
jgi:hypothetical protein